MARAEDPPVAAEPTSAARGSHRALRRQRDRISVTEGDGIEVMRQHADEPDTVFFIDPPYTAAGKRAGQRLYSHFQLDHTEFFQVTATLAGDFLMTYDDATELHALAEKH